LHCLAQGLVGVSGAVWTPRLVRMGKLEAFSSAANKRFHLDAQAAQYATRGDPSLRGAHEFSVAMFVLCSHSDARAGAVRHPTLWGTPGYDCYCGVFGNKQAVQYATRGDLSLRGCAVGPWAHVLQFQ